jgi:hypothetical protein
MSILSSIVCGGVACGDWAPGEIAEMDFGRLGTLVHAETGARQVVWALTVILPFSRFAFVWLLVHQTLDEVIAGLDASWQFFGGMPQRLIIDNFPAAVAGPDALEPRLTRGFLEYSQARGFIVDPARVRGGPGISHIQSASSRTCSAVSGMAVRSSIWRMLGRKPRPGAGTWLANVVTGPRSSTRSRSLGSTSATTCCRTTANRSTCPSWHSLERSNGGSGTLLA